MPSNINLYHPKDDQLDYSSDKMYLLKINYRGR